ncbi:MAG: AAA family ATPase [Candidatus Lokiarchaeota archaeon]|nr:AAA family ATPase [Candidatus Lokiarchaeota archaeon]
MIIAISGLHGVGKSTIGRMLADHFNLEYYSTGQTFRDLAEEMDMTLEEFTDFVEEHPEIDRKLDKKVKEKAQNGNILVDSQLSGFLLEDLADYKILLASDLETRVSRMAERDDTSYNEKLKETLSREKSERDRFKELYEIDLGNKENVQEVYDIILPIDDMTIEEVFNKLVALINS